VQLVPSQRRCHRSGSASLASGRGVDRDCVEQVHLDAAGGGARVDGLVAGHSSILSVELAATAAARRLSRGGHFE
jgi:hypothetical protein